VGGDRDVNVGKLGGIVPVMTGDEQDGELEFRMRRAGLVDRVGGDGIWD